MSIPLMKLIARESPYQGWTHAVYVKLAYYQHDITGLCCPSEKRLAADLKISVRTVRREIAILIRDGAITRTKRGTQWGGPSHYVVNRPACPVVSEESDKDNRPNVRDNRTEVSRQQAKCVRQQDRLDPYLNEIEELEEIQKSEQRFSEGQGQAPLTREEQDTGEVALDPVLVESDADEARQMARIRRDFEARAVRVTPEENQRRLLAKYKSEALDREWKGDECSFEEWIQQKRICV